MGKAIFFCKKVFIDLGSFKALETVEAGQKNAVCQMHVNYLLFLAKLNFLNDSLTTTLYLLDFIGF